MWTWMTSSHCDDRTFVHQMRWVRLGTENLRRAIVDYYRSGHPDDRLAQTVTSWVWPEP